MRKLSGLVNVSWVGWAALAGSVCGVGPIGAQDADLNRVTELYEQARPHLERALGVRWEQPPRFRLVAASVLKEQPDGEIDAFLRLNFPQLQGDTLTRAVAACRGALGEVELACYRNDTGELAVAWPASGPMASWSPAELPGDAPTAERHCVQLAVVRAAALRHLRERYQLDRRWPRCRDDEELQVLQALVEGRCQQVVQDVARGLGTEAYVPLFNHRYRSAPDQGPDPERLSVYRQALLASKRRAGEAGLAFYRGLAEFGARDGENRAFNRPPRQAAWLAQPGLYLKAEQQQQQDLSVTLARLEKALPVTEWSAVQQPWSPEMLRQVAAMFQEGERAEKVLKTWEEARCLVWTAKADPGRQVALSVMRFGQPEGARAYQVFAVDLQRKRDELLSASCNGSARVLESRCTNVAVRRAEEAVRCEKKLQLGGAAAPTPVGLLLVRAGSLVFEFSWYGSSTDPAWAEGVLETLLGGPPG